MKKVVRQLLLTLSVIGMVASLFWDTIFDHIHLIQHGSMHPSKDSSGGECPIMKLSGGQAGTNNVDLSKLLKLDDVLEGLDGVEKVDEASLEVITKDELKFYDGSRPKRIVLVAVDSFVFNVTGSRNQYAAEGSYARLAGNAITRALILSSLDPKDMNDDGLDELTEEQQELKRKWFAFFRAKYPIVAKLGVIEEDEMVNNCGEKVFTEEEVNKDVGLAFSEQGQVFRMGDNVAWLYGTQGVRYRQELHGKSIRLYECIGKLT